MSFLYSVCDCCGVPKACEEMWGAELCAPCFQALPPLSQWAGAPKPPSNPLRVLVACEYSGRVRDAFSALGHYAVSCDILPSEGEADGSHYQGPVEDILYDGWDLLIAFPPCTHLSASGARWWPAKRRDGRQQAAIAFAEKLWEAPIPRIAIENPVGCLSTRSSLGKATQIIHPWQYGHGEQKKTCLWLKGLPKLQPTNIVEGREQRIWRLPPSADRAKLRSLTYEGIATAMALQWSNT